ncbi:MAG: hypothetical protein ABGZ35_08045, partial [Planctomycetaceae bacterium]
MRLGPSGTKHFRRGLSSYLSDIMAMSPTRILAIARLTLKEAIRRRALVVFVVFAVLLMFAGWFMSSGNNRDDLQAGVHIWFLLTAISWLILPAVMFLSCWSIPEDIRVRSLHTVVTKPIRRIEIVLGRILGFSGVVTGVVLVMGVAGYIWIQRQVPDSVRDQLSCRIPVYGDLYFKDRQGTVTERGINTGDMWTYRSYIEGNTRARAIWIFHNIDEEDYGDNLNIETRFEAFRTIKGTSDSVELGLEGQLTLVNNLREDAFALFSRSPAFRQFGEELVAGQFQNAATSLREVAESMTDGSNSLQPNDVRSFDQCTLFAGLVFSHLGDDFNDVDEAFREAGKASSLIKSQDDNVAFENFSEACMKLAGVLEGRSDDLLESMPRTEVGLPNFRVTEFHEGQDQIKINRTLQYTADYETLARFLASTVVERNDQEKLVVDGALATDVASQLSETAGMSVLNSELLAEVLQEEIDAEAIKIDGAKLAVADGRSWLGYFDQLARAERLVSKDPAGWVLTADLYDDLVFDGNLRLEVACMNDQMFIGMARPDLFVRLPDNTFAAGYSKALLCTTLMLLLVVVIGVTASTIVKGPVALFLTFGVFIIGSAFHGFMTDILAGNVKGAGLIESATLILQHRAPSAGIDVSKSAQGVIASADKVTNSLLQGASQIIPNFGLFSRSAEYVEHGFDVPWLTLMLPAILTFFGFLIPCVLIASACLKFRELEAK